MSSTSLVAFKNTTCSVLFDFCIFKTNEVMGEFDSKGQVRNVTIKLLVLICN